MKQLVATLSLCFLSFAWAAQSPMSFTVFMNNVKTFHPMIKLAGAVGKIGEERVRAARGNYDPGVSGSFNNKYFQGREYYSVFESELKQAIFTNQSIKAGYEYGAGNYLNPADYTPGNGVAYLGLEAAVLQGLVIDKRRAEVLKAKQIRDITENERKHISNSVLFESACSYSEWLLRRELMKVNTYFSSLAQVRLDAIKALSAIGERPYIDTTETSMLLQQRLLDFQSALIEFQKHSAYIAIHNWIDDRPGSFDPGLFPTDSLEQLMNAVSEKFLSDNSNDGAGNPLLLQYRSKINLLDVERRYRAELIKPVLNFNYNLLSIPVNTGDFPSLSPNNYKWGAQLAFPLFLRNSRAELSIAKLQLNSTRFEFDLKQSEIQNKIKFTVSSVNVLALQLQTASRNVDYSKRMLEAEKLKFENGESSVFLINARESKWLESEIKRLETMSKYIQAVFEYIYLKGTLDFY